jgi:hypothetical protein
LVADLDQLRPKRVRIHDSGDFFSQAYLDAWMRAAREFPRTRFYAYTKSLHLDFSQAPANLSIIQSEGGKWAVDQAEPHSRIFVSHYERRKAGYQDGSHTDMLAEQGAHKIGLVYHGSQPMSEGAKRVFRLKEVR